MILKPSTDYLNDDLKKRQSLYVTTIDGTEISIDLIECLTKDDVWSTFYAVCQNKIPYFVKLAHFLPQENEHAYKQCINEYRFAMRHADGLAHVLTAVGGRLASHHYPLLLYPFVKWPSLATLCDVGLDYERWLHLAKSGARALAELHEKQMVHCDIKPSNMLVDIDNDDSVVLIDFGLVHASGMERLSGALGSPAYICPQAALGSHYPKPCWDIYSFGVVLYELATGKWPFKANDIASLLEMQCTASVPQLLPRFDAPIQMREIILRCLAKYENMRYIDGLDLYNALCRLPESCCA